MTSVKNSVKCYVLGFKFGLNAEQLKFRTVGKGTKEKGSDECERQC